jgi:predicted AlkP superfamily pyrophosphatase or phosphodiesterase
MVTAAYFFVGTEAAIDNVPITYWNAYDQKITGRHRVEQVLDWLQLEASRRPHFITLYFEDVDVATHEFGPGSPQGIASIQRVDGYLDQLVSGIDELPIAGDVYVVIVSDHGQSAVNQDVPPFIIDTVADLDGLTVVDHGPVAFIYFPGPDPDRAAKIRDAINAAWKHGHAMLARDAPADWHVSEAAGFADVIVQADPGFTVYSSLSRAGHASAGNHGWVPGFRDMHGIFIASGPRLPKGLRIPPIRVIDVYPLLMEILGLPITTEIDGDPDLLPRLLQPRQGSD